MGKRRGDEGEVGRARTRVATGGVAVRVGLSLDAELHDVVAADGAVLDAEI